jgi:hypothetical protein
MIIDLISLINLYFLCAVMRDNKSEIELAIGPVRCNRVIPITVTWLGIFMMLETSVLLVTRSVGK